MDNVTYALLAERTAPAKDQPIPGEQANLLLAAIGLGGETGEILELIKKHVFHGHPLDRDRIVKEMGDAEWYTSYLRRLVGVSLEEVHERNIEKLSLRYPEGFFSSERSMNRAAGDE